MNDDKILSKIEKLLAMADSDNQHEAELAMQRAIEIATKHNIELSRVRRQNTDEVIIDTFNTGKGRLPITYSFIAPIVKRFFNVHILTSSSRFFGCEYTYIGKKDDIETAKFIYNFLSVTFLRLWHNYYAKNPNLRVATARKCYFLGLSQGLREKLQETKDQIESNIPEQDKNNYQLMVLDNQAQIKLAIENAFKKVTTVKDKHAYTDRASFQAGEKEGYEINLNAGLTDSERPNKPLNIGY